MHVICLQSVESLRSSNTVWNWKISVSVTSVTVIGRFAWWWQTGRGKCNHQEPRNLEPQKLNLEAKPYFSRKFILLKISRYTVCHECNTKQNVNNSEQLKIFISLMFIFMIYARKTIYHVPTHPWKQSGMPEQAVFKIVKKVHFVKVSFCLCFPGLTQDCLDRSPWFEYKSTPFCSAHVCGKLVLCYQDSNLIVDVCSAFSEWVCLIHYFVI